MSDLDDTSQEWAARIVEAAGPLKDAMGRRTVSVSSDERRDLDALLDALARLTDLADQSGREVKHDRLNIIGAVRGYSEMLAEEASKLHPSIANTLPYLGPSSLQYQLSVKPPRPKPENKNWRRIRG